jgi:hypothetical protein
MIAKYHDQIEVLNKYFKKEKWRTMSQTTKQQKN